MRIFPGTKNRNEGTCGCSQAPKTGRRARSPKPPFCETTLSFPLDTLLNFLLLYLNAVASDINTEINSHGILKISICICVTTLINSPSNSVSVFWCWSEHAEQHKYRTEKLNSERVSNLNLYLYLHLQNLESGSNTPKRKIRAFLECYLVLPLCGLKVCKFGSNPTNRADIGWTSQKIPSFIVKNGHKTPPPKRWGFFMFQCFCFFLIFAFFCHSFSSLPLLLDILMLQMAHPVELEAQICISFSRRNPKGDGRKGTGQKMS